MEDSDSSADDCNEVVGGEDVDVKLSLLDVTSTER